MLNARLTLVAKEKFTAFKKKSRYISSLLLILTVCYSKKRHCIYNAFSPHLFREIYTY